MSKHELEGKFNPKDFEDEIYENWEKKGYFKPSNDKSKKPYTIVIPPPNITGRLHMGHALDETLQDILIRYKRMAGYNALWVPGTDHASIATEAKIVAKLKEEGITLVLDDYGTLEVGKNADLVCLKENPLDAISNVRKIDKVIKDGAVVVEK